MWPYASLSWWRYALHYGRCGRFCGVDSLSDLDYLSYVSENYPTALSILARGTEMSVADASTFLMLAKALKKWRLPVGDVSGRAMKAYAGWIERNREAASEEFIPPYPISRFMQEYLDRALPEVREIPDGRFGPGACAEGYTHAQRFLRLAEWVHASEHWPEVPLGHDDFGKSACRLCAVPKDWDKDRLITVEPCYSTFSQQSVRSAILESIHAGPLKGTCMDLGYTDGQTIQRRLALKASRTGRLATLDLSDASDRVSWNAVRSVMPRWIVNLLEVTRSDSFACPQLGISGHINMFAGMGNATTFAVETLFFSAYVYAVARTQGLPTFVSVFGDDIICRTETAAYLLEHDIAPCFKVNRQKSFCGADYIRESCGIFAYKGVDISTPKISGYQSNWDGALGVCDLHQRAASSSLGVCQALSYAIAQVGALQNLPMGIEGYPSITDWRVRMSALPETRWNPAYQRREARVVVREPLYRDYSLSHPTNGVMPSEWLASDLCGLATVVERRHRCYIRFPSGKFEWRKRWRATC